MDIRDINIQWLRSKIGIVSQEPVLFSFTIRENICYGKIDEKVELEEVIKVAKDANINDRIQALPDVNIFLNVIIVFINLVYRLEIRDRGRNERKSVEWW